MKIYLVIAFAVLALVSAAQLPDSATQGPNPQDIATPEPEYIDIDEPALAAAPPPALAPLRHTVANIPTLIQQRSFVTPAPRPVQRPSIAYLAPQRSYQQIQHVQPLVQHVQHSVQHQVPGHIYSSNNGYQYRRPVYVKRVVYRRRF